MKYICTIRPQPETGDSTRVNFDFGEKGEQRYDGATLTISVGEQKKLTPHDCAVAVAGAVRCLQDKKKTRCAVDLGNAPWKKITPREFGELVARYIGLTTYHFTEYVTDEKRHVVNVEHIEFFGIPAAAKKMFESGCDAGALIDESVRLARTLGNHHPAHMHPSQIAAGAQAAARGVQKLSVRVLSKKEIEKEKMGGLLGVSAGSVRPPAFIIMEYHGAGAGDAPVVLVGKGITFDSGGISIKPSDKMDEMKFDMMGGATVIAAVHAAAQLKLKKNVVGLIPAAENLPSGSAIVPSDILKMHSGKTVEVLNTDAEGRLILADALSYAARYKPRAIVDLATLTGACVVALGELHAGLWSTDEKLARALHDASDYTHEQVWRLPLGDYFSAQIKSEIADLKNIGERWGSANSAAAFLQAFVPEQIPWAHLDIAGVAWSAKLSPSRRTGASGWGVALLVEYLRR